MNVLELIEKKKKNIELTNEEIKFIVNGYVSKKIPDYQIAAFSMAVWFNGMSLNETVSYTKAMMNSGDIVDLSSIDGVKVDKHSTGGVGDKVTLILAPLLASAGVKIAKMSGRGLGFTGGTIDKLESIPGYKVERTIKDFVKQVNEIGISIIGQTNNLVPGDKLFYALRDVTGTVDSIPLITGSIMSKKLATGADAILLDVKMGDGAFIKKYDDAKTLGNLMINIGKKLNKDVKVEITNMSRPLGKQIGNKNEVLEAIDFLSNKDVSDDLKEVIYSSAATMLLQAKLYSNYDDAKKQAVKLVESGKALEKFKEWIKYQNGDIDLIFRNDFWNPKYKHQIKATKKGYMNILSAVKFGLASVELGAGRHLKNDSLDFEAGITLNKKTNEEVNIGDVIITLYSSKKITKEIVNMLIDAYEINKNKVKNKIILGKLD